MKTIIAGTRHATAVHVSGALIQCPFVTAIIKDANGEIRITGADFWGEVWAKNMGIPVAEFSADWDTHGRAAGPIRNSAMADYADALILVWDGKSRGSADMLRKAKAAGLRIFVWDYAKSCEVV